MKKMKILRTKKMKKMTIYLENTCVAVIPLTNQYQNLIHKRELFLNFTDRGLST